MIHLTVPEDAGRATVEVRGLDSQTLSRLDRLRLDRAAWEQVLRVAVEQAPPADESLPAVAGSYAVEDTLIRFTPMFPFDAGRRYIVTFDPSRHVNVTTGVPAVSVVSLAGRTAAGSNRVEGIYPTAGELPENVLRAYIYFSAPMGAESGLRFVKLLDAAGNEVSSPFLPLGDVLGRGLWDRERRRFTIFFDPGRIKRGLVLSDELGRPMTREQIYTLVVDREWLDAEGNMLVEEFRKTYRVGPPDVEPIDLADWELRHVPLQGTRERLVVSFPDPLDHALLSRALTVTTRAGTPVSGEVDIREAETEWAFVPDEPWAPGDYVIQVRSFLEDLAGNRIGVPFEVTALQPIVEGQDSPVREVRFSIAR